MLYTPSTNPPAKRSKTGIVGTSGPAGFILRRRGAQVQPAGQRQVLWRQVFQQAKRAWLSAGPGGANYITTDGFTPQEAWSLQSDQYFGILQPGPTVDGVLGEGSLVGCQSAEAFFVMVQTTLAGLGLGAALTPQTNTSYIGSSATDVTDTVGSYEFLAGNTGYAGQDPLSLRVALQVSASGNITDTFTPTITGLPAGLTATPGPPTFPFIYDPTTGLSTATGNLNLQLTPYATPATATATITVTGSGGTGTLPFPLAITTGNLVTTLPPPLFAFPNNLGAATEYDLTYTPTGFNLVPSYSDAVTYPMSRYSIPLPGLYVVTASPAYTSSYTRPAVSSWSPILASGPYMPSPAAVLAAWQQLYGQLPPTGNIGFLVQYVDPATGCPGPALSTTATWAQGTLKGGDLNAWTGPAFSVIDGPADASISAPGSTSVSVEVGATATYTGVITLSLKSATIIATGANSTTKALPAGLTFAFSNPTITFASGSTADNTSTLTLTAASGATQFAGKVEISLTDGIITRAASFELTLSGDTTAQPPANFLSIAFSPASFNISSTGTVTATITLSNTGPEDQYVTMQASSANPGLTFGYSPIGLTVPGGTIGAPGTATTTLSITIATGTDLFNAFVNIIGSAGVYTAVASLPFIT